MRSHFSLNQGVTAACAVAGAATVLHGTCAAQPFIAADYAADPTYAAGWSAGQNGGYGFGPWSMDNTLDTPIQNAMDSTSPFNPFGVAWTLYNANGPAVTCFNPPNGGTDISRAGRSCSPLQPGQTFSTIIANPTERKFYRGYTIRLVTGGDNTSYYTQTNTLVSVGTFEYLSNGRWFTTQTYNTGRTTLFDTDTSTNGMQLDITMTDTNIYHLVMTPLGNPAIAYSEDGTLTKNFPVNWIEYEFYNTDSAFYPIAAQGGCQSPTDFYIKSMTIAGLTLNIQRAGTDVVLTWPGIFTNFNLESTLNLGAPSVWNPVTPLPSVVNGLNVVTNSVLKAHQQFYRLHYQP
jgi:hypothetical protein